MFQVGGSWVTDGKYYSGRSWKRQGVWSALCEAPEVLTKHTIAILVLLQQSNNDCFNNWSERLLDDQVRLDDCRTQPVPIASS